MSYTALYRKWRPDNFEDVKGQDHIVTTLKNQIKLDRLGHAYLFCGTRGTGKTTIAKLLAKTVNCEHPVDGSPCNECNSCKAISMGASMNVIEIDAASNNSVDNIRNIIEEVQYAPTNGKFKVYIIDEVHMLSIGAFNALLKTLEEPPSYVIFILATTESHKIPITILSRCQRYDFKRISIDTISARLNELIAAEELSVEEKAVRYIAKAADGSMRDALSLLDQCVAFYLGSTLTYDNALEVLGAVDTDVFSQMLRLVIDCNVSGCIRKLEDIIMQGKELSQFVTDFTWYLRNLLLVKTSDDMEDVLDMSTENIAKLKEESEMIDSEVLMRYIRVFSELSNSIKYSTQKRVLVEIALIKLTRPAMEENLDSIFDRLSQLEKKIENGVITSRVDSNITPVEAVKIAPEKIITEDAMPDDIKLVIANWKNILDKLAGGGKRFLRSAQLSITPEGELLIVISGDIAKTYYKREEHAQELKDVINNEVNKAVRVQFKFLEEGEEHTGGIIDIQAPINMAIEIEED